MNNAFPTQEVRIEYLGSDGKKVVSSETTKIPEPLYRSVMSLNPNVFNAEKDNVDYTLLRVDKDSDPPTITMTPVVVVVGSIRPKH